MRLEISKKKFEDMKEKILHKIGDYEISQAYYNCLYYMLCSSYSQYEQYFGENWLNEDTGYGMTFGEMIENDTRNQIEQMAEENIISPVQKEAVDIASLHKFAQSDLGKRLRAAVMVKKEFSFYSEAKAKDFYPQASEDEKILIQGTMDCFFKDADGNIVLLDYKTDKVSEDGAKERGEKYYTQLKLYKDALEAISEQKVSEAYLYFLNCDIAISIDELEKGTI